MNGFVFSPAAQCEGKKRFGSPGMAHQVAARRAKRDKATEVYRCVHCGGWHLGHAIAHLKKRPF